MNIIEALSDDLNTPAALAELRRVRAAVNRREQAPGLLVASALPMGLLQSPADEYLQKLLEPWLREWTEEMVEARRLARAVKDFARADAIREELRQMGITLEDSTSGTNWRRT